MDLEGVAWRVVRSRVQDRTTPVSAQVFQGVHPGVVTDLLGVVNPPTMDIRQSTLAIRFREEL